MTRKTIDHGDVVETRYTILTAPDDPDMIVVRPDLVPDAVERENVYFLRRDGQLCDGHLHDSLDDARACIDRTKMDGLWQDLARIMGDVQLRINAEYGEYRKNGGTLSGDEWLEQRNEEHRQPTKRSRAKASTTATSASSARPTLAHMAGKKKGGKDAEAGGLGPLPSQTKGEVAQALVKAAVSVVPVAGGPLAELVGLVLQPAIGRRRDVWLGQLETAIEELQKRPDAPSIEELSNNEVFVSVVLNATQAALRTHQTEKLEALRAAVMNSALPMAPDEHTQLMFVRFIDELMPLHLRILSYGRDPAGWLARNNIEKPNIYMGPRSAVLEVALPELQGRSDVYSRAMNDPDTRGMIGVPVSGMVSQQSLHDKLTSPLGDRFLDFITAPPPK